MKDKLSFMLLYYTFTKFILIPNLQSKNTGYMDMMPDETYMLNYYRKLGINLYMMYVFIYIDWHTFLYMIQDKNMTSLTSKTYICVHVIT